MNIEGCKIGTSHTGRFPANLIHDGSEEVLELFPNNNDRFFYKAEWSEDDYQPLIYCDKASKSERDAGLKGFVKKTQCGSYNFGVDGSLDDKPTQPRANHHPTVKPVKLMMYLVKLVTPKNSTVLDLFMGSGTTGIACKLLNRNFIGIELSLEYFEIAQKRIEAVKCE